MGKRKKNRARKSVRKKAIQRKKRQTRGARKLKRKQESLQIEKRKRLFQIAVFFTIGFLFTTLSIIGYLADHRFFHLQSANDMFLSGPVVQFATNRPNQEVTVYSNTDESGETRLMFVWDKDSEYSYHDYENLTVWAYIWDDYDFNWNCEGEVHAVSFEDTGGDRGTAKTISENSGVDKNRLFKVSFYRNKNTHVNVIRIKSCSHFKMIEGDKCHLRIPVMLPWHSATGIIRDYMDGHPADGYSQDIPSDDTRLVNRNINGEDLFIPLINYTVTVLDQARMESGYQLKSIEELSMPDVDALRQGVYFTWRRSFFFIPRIEYTLLDYDSESTYKSNLWLMILGIGLALLLEGVKVVKNEKK